MADQLHWPLCDQDFIPEVGQVISLVTASSNYLIAS